MSRFSPWSLANPGPSHTPAPSSGSPVAAEFNGSRSDFITAILKERAAGGVTPSEIATAFAARKIGVSKNLIYNVLSLMFKRKKVRKSGGRYFPKAVKAETRAAAPPKKRRISEEGMRRIIAATKKRWALQRAAKAKAAKSS
jgi:hypothetical protein